MSAGHVRGNGGDDNAAEDDEEDEDEMEDVEDNEDEDEDEDDDEDVSASALAWFACPKSFSSMPCPSACSCSHHCANVCVVAYRYA